MIKTTTATIFCAALATAVHADGKGAPVIEPRVIVEDTAGSSGDGHALAIAVMLLATLLVATSD